MSFANFDQNAFLGTLDVVVLKITQTSVYVVLVCFPPNSYNNVYKISVKALESPNFLHDGQSIIVGDFNVPAYADYSVSFVCK